MIVRYILEKEDATKVLKHSSEFEPRTVKSEKERAKEIQDSSKRISLSWASTGSQLPYLLLIVHISE